MFARCAHATASDADKFQMPVGTEGALRSLACGNASVKLGVCKLTRTFVPKPLVVDDRKSEVLVRVADDDAGWIEFPGSRILGEPGGEAKLRERLTLLLLEVNSLEVFVASRRVHRDVWWRARAESLIGESGHLCSEVPKEGLGLVVKSAIVRR